MPQWIFDLILNIFSEIIGIGLTVFFVDKIIKNREEKRWLRSRSFIYARLIRFSSEIAFLLTTLTTYQLKRKIYSFEGVMVGCDEFDIKFTKEHEKEIVLNIHTKLEGMTIVEKSMNVDRLCSFVAELDNVLNDTAQLIEPELLTILLELRENFEKIRSGEIQTEIYKHNLVSSANSFEYSILKILKNLKLLSNSLLSKSDNNNSFGIHPNI